MVEEDEWEEQYVFVELIGMVDPDKLSLCTQENTAILGVDSSEMTVMKLGGYAFAGHYEDSCGTMVLFEETEKIDNKQLHYRCHTTKVLKASRVFLKPKLNPSNVSCSKDKSTAASKTADQLNKDTNISTNSKTADQLNKDTNISTNSETADQLNKDSNITTSSKTADQLNKDSNITTDSKTADQLNKDSNIITNSADAIPMETSSEIT